MKREKLRIVLLCDNVIRELAGLKLLKKELIAKLKADVHIIGSIAEIQRTYFELAQIKPHVVFISQIMEKDCRNIAEYVRRSGGMLCILPAEITPARVVETIIVNPNLTYDHLLDAIYVPGQRMYSFFNKTDIKKSKVKITGSPKVDVMLKTKALSRKKFFEKHHLPTDKPTAFFFTSFPRTDLDYFKSDKAFSDNMKLMKRIHIAIRETHETYIKELPKICEALPTISIVLKPHPLEELSVYEHLKQYPNFYLVSDASVYDCIHAMDVAVHWNSTVCTEFWMHHIPTLQFTPLKKHDWLLSDFSPGNPVFHSRELLVKEMRKQLIHKKPLNKKYLQYQKKYFTENFYKVDGKSSTRIATALQKLVTNKQFQLDYKRNFSPLMYGVKIVEKTIGIPSSRRLIAAITGSYNWRYAVDNCIS